MRALKDSKIEWIGLMPEEWDVGQIGHLYNERKEKVSDYDYEPLSVTMKGIVPQLSTAAKTDAHDDRKLVCMGDFAINSRSDRRGSCGISAFEGSVSLINTVLTPRNEMDPCFFDWLFHTTMFADEYYKWGHGIVDDLWTTNWSDMKKISVPIPAIEEQGLIASYLNQQCEHIDRVIENTRLSIEEYKLFRKSVITKAVREGVRGKRRTKDSGIEWIGEIPEEWELLKKLSYAVTEGISYGIVKLFDPDDENGIRVIRCSDVREGVIVPENIRTVTKKVSDEYKRTLLRGGEVLVNVRGTLGGCAVVPEEMKGYNIAREVAKIALDSSMNSKYVMYYLLSSCFEDYRTRFLSGSVYVGLNIEMLSSCTVIMPSFEEQQEIVEYLDKRTNEIDSLIAKKEQFLMELENYKKSLIYEYVTGKKEVPHS